ncbi:hypothetical protein K469DRAFT_750620 [Zopfia rhizophila CBS 207.26]|uniref:Uncharacterized protein n=1 Tax=Zopfia rhizophila CBS 207.26 TaxID=1314779 RepID=A0A6A6E1P8_9PEZI|nr:hypothetical protein K469DRAFT_750620 [Zopfia rhizophila CBS 207.26]
MTRSTKEELTFFWVVKLWAFESASGQSPFSFQAFFFASLTAPRIAREEHSPNEAMKDLNSEREGDREEAIHIQPPSVILCICMMSDRLEKGHQPLTMHHKQSNATRHERVKDGTGKQQMKV